MKLFLLFTLSLLVQYSSVMASVVKNRIYVSNWSIAPNIKVASGLIHKNTYDVIYETRKYELYLVDESAKENPFISNYERLSVSLNENQIEVSLSEKSVTRKRSNEKSVILELRLALYELFFGRRYLKQNLAELTENSIKRMEKLDRLEKKQQLANSKKISAPKSLNLSRNLKKEIGENTKGENDSSENVFGTEKDIDQTLNSKTKSKPDSRTKTISADKNNESDLNKAASKSENKAEPTTSIPPNTEASKATEQQSPTDSGMLISENKANQAEVDVNGSPAEKDSFILGFLGYSSFEGENKEIITTKTSFEFITAGIRWTNEITKEASKGFFANLDEELRLLYRKSLADSKYDIPNGRQIEFYMGAPLLGGGISLGVTGTHETSSFAAIKGITKGIQVVELGELLVGPEIKFLINRSRFRIQGYIGHQIPITVTSNIDGDVQLNKTQFEIDALDSSNWGLGLRYERYDIGVKRSSWNSQINPAQFTTMMFVRF